MFTFATDIDLLAKQGDKVIFPLRSTDQLAICLSRSGFVLSFVCPPSGHPHSLLPLLPVFLSLLRLKFASVLQPLALYLYMFSIPNI